jgi:hypothetical protein
MTSPYRAGAHQKVAFTATAGTVTNGASIGVNVVRVVLTSAGYIAIGAVATANGIYMPADRPEYFVITPGQKVSAIQATAGGDLHVTEMTR